MTRRAYATAPLHVAARDPAKPADYDEADIAAIQAMATGTAHADQQRRALRWIVETAADAYGLSYRGGDTQAMAFAEGKRFVGLQIVKLTRLRLDAMRKAGDTKDGA